MRELKKRKTILPQFKGPPDSGHAKEIRSYQSTKTKLYSKPFFIQHSTSKVHIWPPKVAALTLLGQAPTSSYLENRTACNLQLQSNLFTCFEAFQACAFYLSLSRRLWPTLHDQFSITLASVKLHKLRQTDHLWQWLMDSWNFKKETVSLVGLMIDSV